MQVEFTIQGEHMPSLNLPALLSHAGAPLLHKVLVCLLNVVGDALLRKNIAVGAVCGLHGPVERRRGAEEGIDGFEGAVGGLRVD